MAQKSEQLIAELVAGLEPVRPLRQRSGMARAILALIGSACGMVWLVGLRADILAGRPDAMLLMSGGLFLVLALASAWTVIDMARPYVGTRREGWGWTALMAGVLPAAALILIGSAWMRGVPSGLDMDGVGCMKFGLAWSVLTFVTLALWLRRGAPMQPARAGLLTGVAAGSAGIFAVTLICPHNDLVHIGIWHGLTVIIAGLAGRIAVPRLIAW